MNTNLTNQEMGDREAFPVAYSFIDKDGRKNTEVYMGMSLRVYYAGKAMNGILSVIQPLENAKSVAAHAVRCADALIAALNERKE